MNPHVLLWGVTNYSYFFQCAKLEAAVDVGCGSGQSTPLVAQYFKTVTGLDISKAQLDEAIKKNDLPNVHYK